MYQVPLVVYEQLKGATPEGRREIVLSLIEEHPRHRLELPKRDGVRADLTEVDLSRKALQELVERRGGATPPWWDADLQGAQLSDADLRGAKLSIANLQGAILGHANLECATLRHANLERTFLWHASLQGAHLQAADLQGARLWDAKLQNANLTGAKLQGAILHRANLERAILWDARLQGVDLSRSKIGHCYLGGAWLDRTRLRREQLGGAVGEELAHDYAGARIAYLGLKQNFDSLGDHAASGWAYCRERRMEKREALKAGRYSKVLTDQVVELVCDYGEGFGRVLVCLAVLWVGFALFYGIMGHVLADCGQQWRTTRCPVDLLAFSLATMVTLEAPGLHVYPGLLMRILMPLEAALDIFFLGLLGFVAGNRIRRS